MVTALAADSDRTAVTVTASMRLRYPSGGGYFFTDEAQTVSRSARLFIGSPEDRAYRTALDAWRHGARIAAWWPVLAGLGGLGLVLAAVGSRQVTRAGGRGGFGPAERAERDARLQAGSRRNALGDTGMVAEAEVVIRPGGRGVVQQVAVRLSPPDPASPAERAAIRTGDMLVSVDRSLLHSARPPAARSSCGAPASRTRCRSCATATNPSMSSWSSDTRVASR